ncbi:MULTISPECIES: RBBP9/YdeN family alpha/beta hydrolase [unclassified Streptomyces]|uniref:RBBP9/YdeN family alpha/beta hydrolase n=1 Tax=unclassified Streptomyces TaxID=2593676 RepID=UPI0022B62B78|nr:MULTISPECIES: alpha/beta hydrolase [unclassified Streptomyces]MCZ7415045.1 alpha/beta hydrolase [Streptomyces sp. WMMC897]MCZ7431988.1 alpha/beta hydrolase [Streptomyces sp. WMMC1477]
MAEPNPAGPAFLLLHGWQHHRPEGHWLRRLADELAALGHDVAFPQLPDPDAPDPGTWLAELDRHLAAAAGRERVVVCHSLGCLLWLRAAARGHGTALAHRVLLVAPPASEVALGHPEIAAFAHPAVTADAVAAAAPQGTRLVGSDDDPYCPGGAAAVFGEPLGIDTDTLPGQAHLDLDAGYGPWPDALRWCLDPTVRLGPRPTP